MFCVLYVKRVSHRKCAYIYIFFSSIYNPILFSHNQITCIYINVNLTFQSILEKIPNCLIQWQDGITFLGVWSLGISGWHHIDIISMWHDIKMTSIWCLKIMMSFWYLIFLDIISTTQDIYMMSTWITLMTPFRYQSWHWYDNSVQCLHRKAI